MIPKYGGEVKDNCLRQRDKALWTGGDYRQSPIPQTDIEGLAWEDGRLESWEVGEGRASPSGPLGRLFFLKSTAGIAVFGQTTRVRRGEPRPG